MTRVLITGATGTVGSSVVRLVRGRGTDVRAFVRDPQRAAAVLGDDVELAVGDFADAQSLAAAMEGIDRVFLSCANHPRQVEYEANAIDTAAGGGVERIVKLSAVGAEIGSPLEFWDAQGRIEQHLAGAGIPATVLRPTTYMTGVLAAAGSVAQLGKLFVPAGQARIAMIDPRDVAEVAAVALVAEGPDAQVLTLTGPEPLTYGQVAHQLSAAIGRPVDYVDVPDEEARSQLVAAGLPAWLVANLITLFRLVREGRMSETTDTVLTVTGRAPRHFAQFATDFADAFQVP